MYTYLVLALITILAFKFLNKRSPPAILGIYQRPGKWYCLKVVFFYLLLQIRKLHSKFRKGKKTRSSKQSGYGCKSRASIKEMDCRQPLSNHPKAIDAVYFNLASQDGWHLITGTAHRPQGVVNGFLYLKVPKIGLLIAPKLPDTLLFRDETDKVGVYGAEGLEITPFTPMRIWRLQYNGKMVLYGDPNKTFKVELNAVWNSGLPYFDFDTDMDPLSVSRSMALEPWSHEYFNNLKDFHQTHYEQHGDLHGELYVDGERHSIVLNGVRDHSYGEKREWKNFYRYALHFITLENGTRISAGVVCVPLAFSRMELGYVYLPTGELLPIQSCSLQLQQHGERGTPPSDYGFSFNAGGKTYHVQVEVTDSPEFFIGWEWETRVVERLTRFTVNGMEGWGATEWVYRHMNGRPASAALTDPSWTRELCKG